ncbi:MAG: pentapeptide repeat-containing protein [Methanosarcina sp.]|uniref:pentapeptide repeat-containing protein n=1 Tax=Methanosarcina sp. TaxID=2213 RepID=UPI002605B70C|nr:pentapeptide repeat-containing protein [Methanosarcina sp.]MDD3246908.1 pentapeptide repeat-containing protein [Methanosarcina sp.]MDD4247974.1 pentapeptide repeat-containing protein [Methanosarcina sp.]
MALRETYEKARQHKLLIWVTIVFAVSFVLIALFLSYLVFTYPVNQVSQYGITNATEKANLINQYRTTSIQFIATLAQILGGIAVGIGIYFAWKNLKIAQEGQITERFTRAIDQLGNDKLEIRLGGIYALERIANESEKDYWPIMEILTAYIRENSSLESDNIKHEDIKNQNKISLDIQAILTVIRRRKHFFEFGEPDRLDLHRTNLQEANLRGATLKGADLRGANLQGADLRDTDFSNTDLIMGKEADLQGANLRGANLRMADFQGANLINADLRKAFLLGTYLLGADLQGAKLQEADLMAAYFRGADLMAANFQGADLRGANFQGARNLLLDQLSRVRTLKDTKFDEEILISLKEKYSDLLEAPSELEQSFKDLQKYEEQE